MTFLGALGAFLAAVAAHAVACRMTGGRRRFPLFVAIGAAAGLSWILAAILLGADWSEVAAGALLHAFLCELYLFLMTLTNSVTLRLLADLAAGAGVTQEPYSESAMIQKRLEQMLAAGLLRQDDRGYGLTASGRRAARIFRCLQRLLRPDLLP